MKLFVWGDAYRVRYGSAMAFAVADTEEQAREILAKAPGYSYGLYDNDPNRNDIANKPPTRVVELPCGEWHEWSE